MQIRNTNVYWSKLQKCSLSSCRQIFKLSLIMHFTDIFCPQIHICNTHLQILVFSNHNVHPILYDFLSLTFCCFFVTQVIYYQIYYHVCLSIYPPPIHPKEVNSPGTIILVQMVIFFKCNYTLIIQSHLAYDLRTLSFEPLECV